MAVLLLLPIAAFAVAIPLSQATSPTVPSVPGDGINVEVFLGVGGGQAPQPSHISGRTPNAALLSPVIDFPHPGNDVSISSSFQAFFADTVVAPDSVKSLQPQNFVIRCTALLKITKSLDRDTGTSAIDVRIGQGSDDGHYLMVGSTYLGGSGDHAFTYYWYNLEFEGEGLYPVYELFAANNAGISGVELSWQTVSGQSIIPQSNLYTTAPSCSNSISFEENAAGTVITDQYSAAGIVFNRTSGDLQITNAQPTRFVPVSGDRVYGDPASPAASPGVAELTFVVPGTSQTGAVDYFSCYVINATTASPATVTAYDAAGTQLFTGSYSPGGAARELVEINRQAMHRIVITLGEGANTSAIDNVCFSNVYGDTVPPETSITAGPDEEGLVCADTTEFTFSGSDNLTAVDKLAYKWRLDGGAWQGPSASTTASPSAMSEGSHTFEVAAVDQLGNQDETPDTRHFTVRTSAPVISGLTVTAGLSTSTIEWTTNHPANESIDYGEYVAGGSQGGIAQHKVSSKVEYSTEHAVYLADLIPGKSYYYIARSSDECGREVVSEQGVFTTQSDTEAPDTSITGGPAEGAVQCTDSATFSFFAIDNYSTPENLMYVWRLDEGAWQGPAADTTASLTAIADGPHTVEVAAVDQFGNQDATPEARHFTVDANPPVVSDIVAIATDAECRITYTTDVPAVTQVNYGTTVDYGTLTPLETSPSTSHMVVLSDLTRDTPYHFVVLYANACEEPLATPDNTFTTMAGPHVSWVDWTSGTAGTSGTATGVLQFDETTVDVSYSGEIAFIQTDGGTFYYTGSPSPYVSEWCGNGPATSDIIALSRATAKTMTFSEGVSGLLFAVVSLNGNGYEFNQDFDILSCGCGFFSSGTLTKQDMGNGKYRLIGSGEPHGVIRFRGVATSITWTSLTDEYWNGFTVGTYGVVLDTAPPSTQITSPSEGAAICTDSATVQYEGLDDVTPVGELRYQWRLDGGAWSDLTTQTSQTLTGLVDGAHVFEVVAIDIKDKVDDTPAVRHFAIAAAVPTASGLNAAPSVAGCMVSYETDIAAATVVEYGTTDSYGSTMADSGLSVHHTVSLSGLTPGTLYHYRVAFANACGETLAISTDGTFRTLPDDGHPWIWDAAPDFSSTANPNGEWSSGWTATLGSEFSLFPVCQWDGSNPAWRDPPITSSGAPCYWKNMGAGWPYGVGPGEVALHPGGGNQYAVLRWTAPFARSFAVNAQFLAGDRGDTDANLLKNDSSIWYAGTTGSNPAYSAVLALGAGDTLDFVVGSKGSFGYDNTPVNVKIRTVPDIVPDTAPKLWLRADSVRSVPDGGPVAGWTDSSGNGLDVSQGNAGNQPAYIASGFAGCPVLRFDGDDHFYRDSVVGSQLTSTDQASIFMILKQNGADARNTTLAWGSQHNRLLVHSTWDDALCLQHGDPETSNAGSVGGTQRSDWDDNWHVLELYRDGTYGAILVDGGPMPVGVFGDTPEINETHRLWIANDNWGNTFTGDIAEILVYDRALSDDERIGVVTYLTNRYALGYAVAPETQITSGPSEGQTVQNASVTFDWTGTDDQTPAGELTYSYRVDDEEWSDFAAATSNTFVNLDPGAHAFEVRARDGVGCIDASPAVRHFTIDVDRVLFVNVNGGYDSEGWDFYQTVLQAGAAADWVRLSGNGQAAAMIQSKTYQQIWVYDLSTASDNYPDDYQAIADWYHADPTRAIVCDARILSSYWQGHYTTEGRKLSENYYHNVKANGGGLMLGTDHDAYHTGTNDLANRLGLLPFSGNFGLSMIPVDVTNPLMSTPNDMGGQLHDDSSTGQVPYGLQPNGRIMYTVAWHSGNPDTPGISATIEGTIGFHVKITAPANGSSFYERESVTFTAAPDGGDGPFTYTWSSSRDGSIGSGESIAVSTLSVGQHTITVTGQDSFLRTDTASITVNIIRDTTAPDTQIDSGPVEGSWQAGTSAAFTFSGSDDRTPAGELVYSYKLDSGAWSAWGSGQSAQYTGIGNGWHTFYARAKDLTGNEDGSPAQRHFAVELSPPGAPSVVDDGDVSNKTDRLHATWSASDPESGISGYEYSIRRLSDDQVITEWESVGADTGVTREGLTLENNKYYYFAVRATNGGGLKGPEGRSNGIKIDTDAPLISNVTSLPSRTQCAIKWDTNEPATSQVEYGETDAYGSITTLDTNRVTGHAVQLAGLALTTPYHFRVRSFDAAGNETVSDDQTFTTGQAPDLTITVLQAPNSAYCTQSVPVRWRVNNIAGGASEDMWADNVFLSTDNALDGGDIALLAPALNRPTNINVNEYYVRTVNVTIPSVVDGDYYLIYKTNVDGTQPELSSDNNSAFRGPIHITTVIAPTIADIPDELIQEQVPYTGPTPVLETGSQPVTWSLVTGPPGMTINSYTGAVSWPHPIGSTQPTAVVIRAENFAGSDNELWNISVPITYSAVAETDTDLAPAGTPVPITGVAQFVGSGTPAANVPVRVKVSVQGTSRYLDATTDGSGVFSTTFYPLPTEAGRYTLIAFHPGETPGDTAQDEFVLVGMTSDPKQAGYDLTPGILAEGTVTLKNLGDTQLTGITASGVDVPAFITLEVNPPSELGPRGSAQVTYSISSGAVEETSGRVGIRFESAEGAVYYMPIDIHVKPPKAALSLQPSSLGAEMLRGSQTLVAFNVTNVGGASTDQFEIVLPGSTPWLTLSTPVLMGPLGPGETAQVVLALMPGSTQQLGLYTGSITVGPGKTYGLTVPFRFDCVSDRTADLTVYVEDEYTYYADGRPRVADAKVQLLDPETAEVMHEFTTDVSGTAEFDGILEGYYIVKVEALKHAPYRETLLVKSGEVNELKAFLPRETVRYNWTVTPTDIPDTTIVTLEATFETQVPTPVVTVSPAVIDLASIPEGIDVTQIDLTIENHGLVKAETPKLFFDTHPNWKITPLVEDLGEYLDAMEVRVVPVRIERLQPAQAASELSDASGRGTVGGEPCVITAHLEWSLVCIGRNWYRVPILVLNASGDCGGGGSGGGGGFGGWGGGWSGGGGGWGGGGGSGGPSSPYTVAPSYTPPNECKPCDPATFEPTEYLSADLSYLFAPAKAAAEAYILAQTAGWLVPEITLEAGGKLQSCCASDGSIGLEAKATATAGIDVRLGNTYFEAEVEEEVPVAHVWVPITGEYETVTVGVKASVGAGLLISGGGSLSGEATTGCMMEDPKVCITAECHGVASVGASAEATGEIKFGDTVIGSAEFTAVAQFKTAANASYEWCNGEGEGKACFEGIYSEVNVGGKLHIAGTDDVEVTLIPCKRTYYVCPMGDCEPLEDCEVDYTVTGPCGGSSASTASLAAAEANAYTPPDFKKLLGDMLPSNIYRCKMREVPADPLTPASAVRPASDEEEGVCAQVRLQIQQRVTLTRTAFTAALELENTLPDPVENVFVSFSIADESGALANNLFAIGNPELTGLTAVDGTGTVQANSTGRVSWLIIPRTSAAPTQDTDYLVGGILTYTQNGQGVQIPLDPARITVKPDPRLGLNYFWQREVYSDDPFTERIEPSEPFSLGLVMDNHGYGTARNVKITSSQPQITENVRGLLVEFKIIGTQIGSQTISPSLTVDLGDIGPQSTRVAQWLMTSTLMGTFKDFSAKYENINPLGDPSLCLIDYVNIHELTKVVRADVPSDDLMPDFLVNDETEDVDPDHLPDKLYLSDASVSPVVPVLDATVDGPVAPNHMQVQLTVPSVPGGWFYVKLPDPGVEQYTLQRVVRSDMREVRVGDNAWTTHRNKHPKGQPLYREHTFHLLDIGGSGSYTLIYDYSTPPPPTTTVHDGKTKADGESVTIGEPDGMPVTAVFPGAFYIESEDRVSGLRVAWTDPSVSPAVANRVIVTGVMRTGADGERYLAATSVRIADGVTELAPMGLTKLTFLGGCNLPGYDSSTGAGQMGIEYCEGSPNNIGLLVKINGRVLAVGKDFVYIDDGTGARDGSIFKGVRVKCAGLLKPAKGQQVAITGISSILKVGDRVFRSITPRTQSDIQVIL